MLEILAAGAPDPLGGLNGWVAAIGTIGLLGPVLYWLCYHHLPAKDKQTMELVVSHTTTVREERRAFQDTLKEERVLFKESLDKIVEHCDKEITVNHKENMEAHEATRNGVREQLDFIKELAVHAGLQKQVDRRDKRREDQR